MIVTVLLFAFSWLCFLSVAVALCVISSRSDRALDDMHEAGRL